jgi:shikimate dehydrogenase
MHNAALKEMGLDREYRYDIKPVFEHELQANVNAVQEGTLEGANVTIPYKTEIMKHLGAISTEATAIGAVNTVYRNKGGVKGGNTDVLGFRESLVEHGVSINGTHASILGAGGAARTVAYALVEDGVSRLTILNRSLSRAEDLVRKLNQRDTCEVRIEKLNPEDSNRHETDLLINCTPIGMSGYSEIESPLPRKALSSDTVVMDLVYNPRRTKLLQEAEQIGCKTIDGTGMLVHQGAAALELWIGKKPPPETMRSALIQALGG